MALYILAWSLIRVYCDSASNDQCRNHAFRPMRRGLVVLASCMMLFNSFPRCTSRNKLVTLFLGNPLFVLVRHPKAPFQLSSLRQCGLEPWTLRLVAPVWLDSIFKYAPEPPNLFNCRKRIFAMLLRPKMECDSTFSNGTRNQETKQPRKAPISGTPCILGCC